MLSYCRTNQLLVSLLLVLVVERELASSQVKAIPMELQASMRQLPLEPVAIERHFDVARGLRPLLELKYYRQERDLDNAIMKLLDEINSNDYSEIMQFGQAKHKPGDVLGYRLENNYVAIPTGDLSSLAEAGDSADPRRGSAIGAQPLELPIESVEDQSGSARSSRAGGNIKTIEQHTKPFSNQYQGSGPIREAHLYANKMEQLKRRENTRWNNLRGMWG